MFKIKIKNKNIVLLLPLIIDLITRVFMQIFTQTAVGDIFYKGGFLIIYNLYLLLFITSLFKNYRKKLILGNLEYFLIVLSLFFIFYSLLLVLISIANGNPINYFFSDFTRSSIFFVVLSGMILYFSNKSLEEKILFIKYFFYFLFFITFIEAISKIILIVGGRIYGDGLNQYMMNIVVLFSLLWIAFKTKILAKKFFIYILIFIGIMLTILSLKRGSWVELIIFFIFYFFTLTNKRKFYFILFFIFFIGALFYFLNDLGLLEPIVNRFMSTYSDGKIDSSSMGRIVEIKGALFSLDKFLPAYITGYGHGSSYFLNPDFTIPTSSLYGSSSESIHHIHPMFMMILYRMGIIGLIFYSLIIILAFRIYLFLIKKRKLLLLNNNIYIYIFATSIAFISDSIQFLKSNGMYGSFYDGLLFFTLVTGYTLIKERKLNET